MFSSIVGACTATVDAVFFRLCADVNKAPKYLAYSGTRIAAAGWPFSKADAARHVRFGPAGTSGACRIEPLGACRHHRRRARGPQRCARILLPGRRCQVQALFLEAIGPHRGCRAGRKKGQPRAIVRHGAADIIEKVKLSAAGPPSPSLCSMKRSLTDPPGRRTHAGK